MEVLSSLLWPVEEAKRVLHKIGDKIPTKGYVLFEGGYGPSGLPHIGTFGEMVRTSAVIHAFKQLAPHIPTKLLVVSDDCDGLRKLPTNLPDMENFVQYLGMPLTSIPDPFGVSQSYGNGMNEKLCSFLNNFGFEYEFASATDYYKRGIFNEALITAAKKYQELMDLMLPTLSPERQATYSPFMPIDKDTEKVLESGVISVDPITATIKFTTEDGTIKEQSFLNGGCKLQWKCDFGMRWHALGVDYEIYGKDHYPNEPIYRSVCSILGSEPPVNFFYELFLDADGKKISKSKGNGMDVGEWLKYTNPSVLSYYMFQKPKTAKRMHFDVVPKTFDTYLDLLQRYRSLLSKSPTDILKQSENPMFFVHPSYGLQQLPVPPEVSFSLLLNIASACNQDNQELFWYFLSKHNPQLAKGNNKLLDEMVAAAIKYYEAFIVPSKKYYKPDDSEKALLLQFKDKLLEFTKISTNIGIKDADDIQAIAYSIANDNNIPQPQWFGLLYKCLLGVEEGPRIGTFVSIYGIKETIYLINGVV